MAQSPYDLSKLSKGHIKLVYQHFKADNYEPIIQIFTEHNVMVGCSSCAGNVFLREWLNYYEQKGIIHGK